MKAVHYFWIVEINSIFLSDVQQKSAIFSMCHWLEGKFSPDALAIGKRPPVAQVNIRNVQFIQFNQPDSLFGEAEGRSLFDERTVKSNVSHIQMDSEKSGQQRNVRLIFLKALHCSHYVVATVIVIVIKMKNHVPACHVQKPIAFFSDAQSISRVDIFQLVPGIVA